MGGRGPTSSTRSMGTGEPPPRSAAVRLRPGCFFGSLSPTSRRQAAFLHVHTSWNVRPCAVQYSSGMYCHWPEDESGSTQPSTRHGPSLVICAQGNEGARVCCRRAVELQAGGARGKGGDIAPVRAGRSGGRQGAPCSTKPAGRARRSPQASPARDWERRRVGSLGACAKRSPSNPSWEMRRNGPAAHGLTL